MSVDVAAGRALYEIVNDNTDPAETHKVYHDSDDVENVAIDAADLTHARIDVIVMKTDVSQNPDAASGNIPSIYAVKGTPAASPAVPTLPANCLPLYHVAVAAGATSITSGNLTDVREYVEINPDELPDMAREATVLRKDHTVFQDWSQLTIASGVVAAAGPLHTIETQGAAASDDLDTITPQVGAGEFLVIKCANASHVVTVKHGTGNIKLGGSVDFALDDANKALILIKQGSYWQEVGRATPRTGTLITLEKRYQASGDYTTTSGTFADIDGTNMTKDVVCTASSILVLLLTGSIYCSSTAQAVFDFSVGGSLVGGSSGLQEITIGATTATVRALNMMHVIVPGAGTKTCKPRWKTDAGTLTLLGRDAPTFTVLKIEP